MDILTFVSSMTGALAWPIVVAAIAYLYRSEIRQLLAGMRRLKVGPMEAEMFESKAREVRELAIALPQHLKTEGEQTTGPGVKVPTQPEPPNQQSTPETAKPDWAAVDDRLLQLVEEARLWGTQRLALLDTWSVLEDALRSFAERHNRNPQASVVMMLLDLKHQSLLTLAEYELLRKLFDLRTSAAVASIGFSEEALLDYVAAASAILRKTGLSSAPGRSARLRASALGVTLPQ